MEIIKNLDGDNLFVELIGRLDTTTAPQLETSLKESIDNAKTLVLDFKQLEYISSAGLRVLLFAQKVMNNQGDMKIVNANDEIKEVFEITGFNDILKVE